MKIDYKKILQEDYEEWEDGWAMKSEKSWMNF